MCRIKIKPLFYCRILIPVKPHEQHLPRLKSQPFQHPRPKASRLQGHKKNRTRLLWQSLSRRVRTRPKTLHHEGTFCPNHPRKSASTPSPKPPSSKKSNSCKPSIIFTSFDTSKASSRTSASVLLWTMLRMETLKSTWKNEKPKTNP